MPTDARQRRSLGEAFANDKDADWLNERVVRPWERGEALLIGGRPFTPSEISKIMITETAESAEVLERRLSKTPGMPVPAGLTVALRGEDVTDQFITGPAGTRSNRRTHAGAAPATDPKNVMVIYGHDLEAKDALFDWLRSIGLRPLEFNELIQATGIASPYTGDVVRNAFNVAQAVIAFFTPDEYVIDRTARADQNSWRLQARPNVLIEAGMALVTHPDRTVIVVLGRQELPSDLAGRHFVRLTHADVRPLQDLATRLHYVARCDTRRDGTDWLNPERFPNRDNLPAQPFSYSANVGEQYFKEAATSFKSTPASRLHDDKNAQTVHPQPVRTFRHLGIVITLIDASCSLSVLINKSGYRTGSGHEKYEEVHAGDDAKFVVIKTRVLNDAKTSIDLTCGYPIANHLIDDRGRRFDSIGELYHVKGNPNCNDNLQPGFASDMTWIYRVPFDAKIVAFEFEDVTDLMADRHADPTVAPLSL